MEGRITALKVQKRNPNRVNVYLDGEYAFGLERVNAAWLRLGQTLSGERVAELQAADSQETALQKALRLLSYRERSEAEIRKNLLGHGVSEETAALVIARLRQSGLADDRRFAHSWAENRKEFRPRSRRAIAFELRRKGVEEEAIQAAVQGLEDDALALQAARKQARRWQALEWAEFRQKMYAFLARRGFSYDAATSAAAQVWAELEPIKPRGVTPVEEDIQ
ncbi:MAG: RecX family transcriptional regulator [Chloroflexi bacterium]|nr:RecX family transcriptional regulator [Chloroflexota bacterium]